MTQAPTKPLTIDEAHASYLRAVAHHEACPNSASEAYVNQTKAALDELTNRELLDIRELLASLPPIED